MFIVLSVQVFAVSIFKALSTGRAIFKLLRHQNWLLAMASIGTMVER